MRSFLSLSFLSSSLSSLSSLSSSCPPQSHSLSSLSSFSSSRYFSSSQSLLGKESEMEKCAAFASDNAAGVHPKIFEALSSLSSSLPSERIGYGFDPVTESAKKSVQNFFEDPNAQVEFTYGGTGANMVVMSLLKKGDGIGASDCAHIVEDEAGGPEFGGNKIYPVKTKNGKMILSHLKQMVDFSISGGFHRAPITMVSITQPTERGTVYTVEEIKEITHFCHENEILVHMDGARVGNALASLDVEMPQITSKAGVDVITFGGTKHGLMYGEAIVIFANQLQNSSLIRLQKMLGQKASKEAFIATQFETMVKESFLKESSKVAVNAASLLVSEIKKLNRPYLSFYYPVEANSVFLQAPAPILDHLSQDFEGFGDWENLGNGIVVIRIMTSFSTTPEKVFKLVEAISNWSP